MKLNPFKDLPAFPMGTAASRKLQAYQSGENGYTLNYMTMKAGSSAPLHDHPHLQVDYILTGKGMLRCGDELFPLGPGDVAQIDAFEPHTFENVTEDMTWLEFFTPEREDFKPE